MLGVLSLIFWSLLLIVSLKYLAIVLRATNRGEGGILALMALAFPKHSPGAGRRRALLIGLGVFGAALLYGDGMITPAISVLSAVEGLNVATPAFEHYVIPITVLTLVGLFAAQSRGTGKVGTVFGPVMVVWFASLAAAGHPRHPEVAAGPLVASTRCSGWNSLIRNGWTGFVVLGAVFLAVTGAEALYADVGHFGARPIRIAWFGLVLPGLFLNYLGQGALVLHDPKTVENPFYLLAPALGAIPAGGAGNGGDGHRVPGADLGRVFPDHSGHPTRLPAAHGGQAHLLDRARPDLPAPYQLGAHGGLHRAGPGLPLLQQHGLGLRHRRDADDALDDGAVLFRRAPCVGLERLARGGDLQPCSWW